MPARPLRLSLLDFGWLAPGQTPAEAIDDTLAVAGRAEELGFARYWLGEHHLHGHCSASPHILAAVLAARTSRIRIGVGAMLLQYWAPLKLAEDFLLLETMFGRIDLGIGRGRADNLFSHRALLDGRPLPDEMIDLAEYSAKLDDLAGYLRRNIPAAHRHYGAAVIPDVPAMPELWICGSATAATEAARIGARFCCTLFHRGLAPPEQIATYRETFRPSPELPEPHAAVAAAGVCAGTDEAAVAIRNRFPNRSFFPAVVGSPEHCRETIECFRDRYAVDDVLLLDIAQRREDRIRSAELLAEAFGLATNTAAAQAASTVRLQPAPPWQARRLSQVSHLKSTK